MKKTFFAIIAAAALLPSCRDNSFVDIPRPAMLDKVKGAWAGKMIGVMYGRPMEFQVTDTMFTDTVRWEPANVTASLNEDDIYGQMNFMMTMEKHGQDVSLDTLAHYFAHASFPLCHANLQARKNYFDGIPAGELALPANSIHCEDIDFQIECDFLGFINPCMPASADSMCAKVGAIMAAGDGMYAGMYIAALHALAFNCSDIENIVTRGLDAIPAESGYARCIRDVIGLYRSNPSDWKAAWTMLNSRWAPNDVCTPYHTFNIDAKLNGAYVVTGLLYGQGDWKKTMDITVGCGQDTDCNTATAAAVLGIIHGYDAIPDIFRSHIPSIADSCFLHTDYSFNKAVSQTMAFISENVTRNGGAVTDHGFRIRQQQPVAAGFNPAFQNLRLDRVIPVTDTDRCHLSGCWTDFVYGDGDDAPYKVATTPGDSLYVEFNGTGIALLGSWNTDGGRADIRIDGNHVKKIDTYYVTEAGKYEGNRAYLFHITQLPEGNHRLTLTNLPDRNPKSDGNKIYLERILVYR